MRGWGAPSLVPLCMGLKKTMEVDIICEKRAMDREELINYLNDFLNSVSYITAIDISNISLDDYNEFLKLVHEYNLDETLIRFNDYAVVVLKKTWR